MTRKLSLMAVLVALILSAFIQPQAASDYCGDTAQGACAELQWAVFNNCMANGGDYQDCKCRDLRAYNSCMQQFGCPGKSEQVMMESGCGPQQ